MSSLASYRTNAKVNAAFEQQIEDLLIQLKNVIIIGTPYRVFDARLACFSCGCMLSVYVDEKPRCLRCDNVRWWSQDERDRVSEIMREYPEQEKKEREMKKQIWFLDIDGVFSIPTKENADQREKFGYGLFCWPTPVAFHLIRAIAADREIHPVWLSCWDTSSLLWNAKAGTRLFPVGYHLSGKQKDYADRLFPEYAGHRIDRKLVAVRYYLRKYPTHEVVWIEDGFMKETEEWATQEGRVKLVDTTQDDILKLMLVEDNLEDAAQEIVQMFKQKPAN